MPAFPQENWILVHGIDLMDLDILHLVTAVTDKFDAVEVMQIRIN